MTDDPHDPHAPYRLLSVPTDIEASAIVGALDAYGIEANATGGHIAGFRAEAPGEVEIFVRQSDAERAQQALAEIRSQP